MPSLFEPCGLPQMVSPKYGSLPIAHNTGGIHDTVEPLRTDPDSGNGFLFDHYNSFGLRWAIDEAMHFYRLPEATRSRQLKRIMAEADERFNHQSTAREYIKLYEQILARPVVAS